MSELHYDDLLKLWEAASKTQDSGPSSGVAPLGTWRWIAARFPDRNINPKIKAILDDPEYSDSVVIEFWGDSFFVWEP